MIWCNFDFLNVFFQSILLSYLLFSLLLYSLSLPPLTSSLHSLSPPLFSPPSFLFLLNKKTDCGIQPDVLCPTCIQGSIDNTAIFIDNNVMVGIFDNKNKVILFIFFKKEKIERIERIEKYENITLN